MERDGSLPALELWKAQLAYVSGTILAWAIRLERHVFSRATEPTLVVTVELGGAVSDPAPAHVVLTAVTGSDRRSDTLPLRQVHNGLYVSTVPTKSLPNGDYAIGLTYPHGALSPVFPFFRNRISRNVGFVVVD